MSGVCEFDAGAVPSPGYGRCTGMPGYATRSYVGPRVGVSWLAVIYLVAGGIVSASHHYWSNVHALKPIASALLATVLWPLILLGINLHIH